MLSVVDTSKLFSKVIVPTYIPTNSVLASWLLVSPFNFGHSGVHWWLIVYLVVFFFFFLMCTVFKVFIEFVTILLLFYVLCFWPWGMWDLSSLTGDRTRTPCIGRRSLNHWTAREVPRCGFNLSLFPDD